MLTAIDFNNDTGLAREHSTPDLPPLANGLTRLLAADYAGEDVYGPDVLVPEEVISERIDHPAQIDEDGNEVSPAWFIPAVIEPAHTVKGPLLRQGVLFEYERRAAAIAAGRPAPVPDPLPVPAEVSNQQLRLALIDFGIMPSAILAQLQAFPAGAEREKALAAWEYANTFRRDHPLVSLLAEHLGLTSAQVDELFRKAAQIQ